MPIRVVALFVLAIGCTSPAPAPLVDAGAFGLDATPPAAPIDPLAELADPLGPARARYGRVHVASSRTPDEPHQLINDDYGHFLSVSGDRGVIVDEVGPGILTRLWFTAGPEPSDAPSTRFHVFVDGAPLEFVRGEAGVTIGALTSGAIAPFRAPWALDDTGASGGFIVSVPIAYERSLRIEIERRAGHWQYWQADVRRTPGATIRSFSLADAAPIEAALAIATRHWLDHVHSGDLTERVGVLSSGAEHVVDATGEGAVTEIVVRGTLDARATAELRVDADGAPSIRATLRDLVGAGPPSEGFRAAYAEHGAVETRVFLPIPFRSSVRVALANLAGESRELALTARVWSTSLGADVGALRVRCVDELIDTPGNICEQDSPATYPNVVVARAEGRGHYAGQSFVVSAPDAWWWMLEGDHELVVDGAYGVLGTGTEDYFGGAFYFRLGPYSSVTSGATGWSPAGRELASLEIHVFRHHVADVVPFDRDFAFEYEPYIDGTRWRGCAYFYLFD